MTGITKLSAVFGSALSAALLSQTAMAGPGCERSGMTAGPDGGSFQPAVMRTTQDGYDSARAYRMGMNYSGNYETSAKAMTETDIVDTAIAAGSFDTLITAVKAAGLVDTLKGKGPFTVFAPTDAAFAKLPKAQLEALLNDKAALAKVLTYHVVAGKVEAADVVKLNSATTVEGQSVVITTGDSVMINNATVIQTDIASSNGVIHVIDSVLLPPDMTTEL